jgi:hypothetical protein
MGSGLFRVIVGLAGCVGVLTPSASPANASGQATNVHVIAGGYADVFGSTCPFTNDPPATDVVCEDWTLQLAKERVGSNADKTVWKAFLFRARYELHPDGTSDTLYVASGVANDPDSYFDEVKLTKAGVTASIPLDDGSDQFVDVAWDGTNAPLGFWQQRPAQYRHPASYRQSLHYREPELAPAVSERCAHYWNNRRN